MTTAARSISVKCVTGEKFTKGDITSGYIEMMQCDRPIALHNEIKQPIAPQKNRGDSRQYQKHPNYRF
ncbi:MULTISPECIES: hypothetical protein [unclassified Microcoleus]|jgi:hypothetical protein|uniref:hypothetical protein n=1 Tax=unclassified Microcoleus TaxID=2642155 RepID=UPI001D39F4B5|nr:MULTISPECIES: hypothetical protein [unclassified Microcoleus]MCC3434855.1 hypothetical protein [Microcoleus sp. PH2017_05_CCC_O_A]MCC3452766.1 hypothetical protein [Microcoleus sp. PH2017_08_TRC_O_A]